MPTRRASSPPPATSSRTAVGLAALLLLGCLAGCGDRGAPTSPSASGGGSGGARSGSGDGSGAVAGSGSGASCVAAIRYDGHLYVRWGRPGRAPDATGRTLSAVVPGCDDTGPAGPHEADQPVQVDVLRATDPSVAVGYRGALYVRQGAKPPAGPRWVQGGHP